jgi:hypothetical protein
LAYLSSPFDLNSQTLPATDVSSVVTSTENRNRRFALENAKNKVSQYFCFCVLLSLLQLALCVREIPQINGESFGVGSAKLEYFFKLTVSVTQVVYLLLIYSRSHSNSSASCQLVSCYFHFSLKFHSNLVIRYQRPHTTLIFCRFTRVCWLFWGFLLF